MKNNAPSAFENPRVSSAVPAGQLSVKEWRALSEEEQEELIEEAISTGITVAEWQRQWEVVVGAYQREVELLRGEVKVLKEQVATLARLQSNRTRRDDADEIE